MLLNFINSLTFQCYSCCSGISRDISLLDFLHKNRIDIFCDECQEKNLEIIKRKNYYHIKIVCCECGDEHAYRIKSDRFWQDGIIEYTCPMSDVISLMTGTQNKIKVRVDQMREEYAREIEFERENICELEQELMKKIEGMLFALNLIHTSTRSGKISCKCGSHLIIADLDGVDVVLTCTECKKRVVLSPETWMELMHIEAVLEQALHI